MSGAREVEQRAALWLLRSEEPGWSEHDQAEFDSWLQESMAHKAAYWRLEHGWRQADRVSALGMSQGYKVHSSRWWLPTAAAASILAMLGTGFLMLKSPASEPPAQIARVDTPVGGRRVIPLADGSRIELNTATVIRTAVSNSQRDVWLDQGEAYFDVAHRGDDPFIVHAGSQTVTVLGTKFSVRRDGDRVTVSVLEGRVRIRDNAASDETARSTVITAGDVAVAQGPATLIAPRDRERVERALAWREGVLRFDGTSLAEAAAEFNRYSNTRIVIDDPDVARIEIGGTFRASNAEAFARLLRDAYGLHIAEEGNRIRISD